MANYVKNIICFSIDASQEKIDKLFKTVIGTDDNGEMIFDFNVLVPMPESLNIERDTRTKDAIKLYQTVNSLQKCVDSNNKEMSTSGKTDSKKTMKVRNVAQLLQKCAGMASPDETYAEKAMRVHKATQLLYENVNIYDKNIHNFLSLVGSARTIRAYKIKELLLELIRTFDKEKYALGETACKNVEQYGYADWYDWRNANWGTKWNSFNVSIDEEERKVFFSTAWSFPEPIASAIIKQFPDMEFTWDYADENVGYGTGEFVYEKGEAKHIEFDGGSDEAYQMYIRCWGDHNLYKDENGNWKWIDDE